MQTEKKTEGPEIAENLCRNHQILRIFCDYLTFFLPFSIFGTDFVPSPGYENQNWAKWKINSYAAKIQKIQKSKPQSPKMGPNLHPKVPSKQLQIT